MSSSNSSTEQSSDLSPNAEHLIEMELAAAHHAQMLARYDALHFLRGAAMTANAGFAKTLALAIEGASAEHVAACMNASEAVLKNGLDFWHEIDSGQEKHG